MSLERIGRYEIKEEIGRGGMATVYRAIDPRFRREVALKVLPSHFLHDSMFRTRFEREAQTIATLEHPAIVPVYDFGEERGQPFLVMRLMRGGSLVERVQMGPLPLKQTAQILGRLAPALDYAHDRAIIHRDLKPQNILFDRWEKPYLSDFGIVKLAEGSVTDLTVSGGAVGTPAYMSPEQVSGSDDIDARSDVYALGVILFEMLTGRLPYRARTPMGLALKHLTDPIPVILEANKSLPVRCQEVIERALAKDREARYPTAAALADAVSELAIDAPDAPFVSPILAMSQADTAVDQDQLATLQDEDEETKLADEVRAAALGIGAVESITSSEALTEDGPTSIEAEAEEADQAEALLPREVDTVEEIDPEPVSQLSGDVVEGAGTTGAIAAVDNEPTQAEAVGGGESNKQNGASLEPAVRPAFKWQYIGVVVVLLLIGVGTFYALSAASSNSGDNVPFTPTAVQSSEDESEAVPLIDEPATETPSSTPAASLTPSPAPSDTATQTPRQSATPQGTVEPSPTAQPSETPSPTNAPAATSTAVPLLLVSLPEGELKNPFNFGWSGSATASHRVVLRHLSEDYSHTSDWLVGNNWTFDIPAEEYGPWEWYVEAENGEQSDRSEFFFNPHTGGPGGNGSSYPGSPGGGNSGPDNPYPEG